MSIDVTSLNSLDPDEVQAREDFIIELIKEISPTLDFTKGGILEQLLAYPNSLLDVMNQEELDRLRRSTSLLEVSKDPELADNDLLEKLLSNYLITRSPGTVASGKITVVMSSLVSVALPALTTFTVNDRTFKLTSEVVAVTTSDLITNPNNVLIQSDGQGNYWFPADVEEDVIGGAAILSGTEFEMRPAPANFVQAYAPLDFNSGAPAASNTDMYRELEEGIAAKAMSDRVSIASLMRKEFPQIIDMEIVGYGDAEMHRDAHNVFGISGGGKADVYVRTSQNPNQRELLYLTLPVAATQTSGQQQGTFSFAQNSVLYVAPTVQPGLYRVERVTRYPDNPSTFGFDLSGLTWYEYSDRGVYVPPGARMPEVYTSEEARYSMYQGGVRIHTTDTMSQADYIKSYRDRLVASLPLTIQDASGAVYEITDEDTLDSFIQSERIYKVDISYMPNIADIQAFVNTYDRQAPTSSDYLVRAVIPCIVTVSARIAWKEGLTTVAGSVIKKAITSAINATTLGSPELPVAAVVNAIDSVIGSNGYTDAPVTLQGDIIAPDGTIIPLTSTAALTIPDRSDIGLTARTTSFITYERYINLGSKTVSW